MTETRPAPAASRTGTLTTRPRRRATVFTVIALVGALNTGCGSSTSTATGGTGTSGPAGTTAAGQKLTAQEKAVKFAECMRTNGVRDFPDPTDKNADSYGVSVTPVVFSRAVSACKALKPPGALSSKRTAKQQSAALRFAQCVREHGVKDFPDPVTGEPLVNTYKIPSSNKPGGMTILNAATHMCTGILGLSAGGQG